MQVEPFRLQAITHNYVSSKRFATLSIEEFKVKLGGVRPLRDANGIEFRRQDPVLVAPITKTDLIAALNHNELIRNVNSCDKASYEIGRAVYGRTMDDLNEFVLEAKTVGVFALFPMTGS